MDFTAEEASQVQSCIPSPKEKNNKYIKSNTQLNTVVKRGKKNLKYKIRLEKCLNTALPKILKH